MELIFSFGVQVNRTPVKYKLVLSLQHGKKIAENFSFTFLAKIYTNGHIF